VRVTAKVDYAVRAAVELAAAQLAGADQPPVKADALAHRQGIPPKFLENILADLRRASLVTSQRGAEGGYRLAAPAQEISVADIIRAVEGPLADVHGVSPEELDYTGPARALRHVWVATRAALRTVLEEVTLAQIAADGLPVEVVDLLSEPDAWSRRMSRG
jgi:Rrf2 family protein